MPRLTRPPALISNAVDAALEVSTVGGFSRLGYRSRRWLFEWDLRLPDMSGRVVLLTGATSGIGKVAALMLAEAGANLILVGRNEPRLAGIVGECRALAAPGQRIDSIRADLTLLAQARDLVAAVRRMTNVVDVIVHNAGALTHQYTVTEEGFEVTFASQVLSQYLITSGLLPLLHAADHPRVITVSSGGMYAERLEPDSVQMSASEYDGVRAYARAKRAQVVMNEEWARHEPQIAFHSMHPGWADTPGVADALPGFRRVMGPVLRTPAQGADTIVWLAGAAPDDAPSGRFWLDRRPRTTYRLPRTRPEPGAAARLWEIVDGLAASEGVDDSAEGIDRPPETG